MISRETRENIYNSNTVITSLGTAKHPVFPRFFTSRDEDRQIDLTGRKKENWKSVAWNVYPSRKAGIWRMEDPS